MPSPTASNGLQNGHSQDAAERRPLLAAPAGTPARADGEALEALEALEAQDGGHGSQRTRSIWYLMLLTLSIGGLQIAWSVELSNGSPYLLSLGLSKSLMALVWIAGPLTGTLVQPYVGMLSDRCRVPWGRRKPFMLGGAAATVAALLGLAWTREVVGGLAAWLGGYEGGWEGAERASAGVHTAVIVVAVTWVYVLDVAINTVQAAIRAFIVDCCPAHQQEAANAMASRLTGVGNILGFVAGYANLTRHPVLGWLGRTQFQDLCSLASLALGSTILISCVLVPEHNPLAKAASSGSAESAPESPESLESPASSPETAGVVAFFAHIWAAMHRLPPQVQKVCLVQFCAWVGFFPMLFYTSSYIGEIYVQPFLRANPHRTPEDLDRLYEEATRVGTFALLVYSITSLCTNVFLPFFIAPTYDSKPVGGSPASASASPLDRLIIPGFTLRRAWMLSLLLFSGSMFCTVLVTSVAAATTLIGLVGITWALTLWAPWAIISAEISRRDVQLRQQQQQQQRQNQQSNSSPAVVDHAGVILGIHNMAIAAPQIFATVGSSIVFRLLQKPRGTPGDRSISVVMALGGITVLLAAYYVHLIEDVPTDLLSGAAAEEEQDGPGRQDSQDSQDRQDSVPGEGQAREDESPGLHRRRSKEQLTRETQDRAALARGSSYGGGLEY